ncbi:MAG TPA: DUF378 domain-containing protein [Candidatus Sulfotelmatobacter sp.]|jgi:uncharacterized membrane protein YuzA (DUF378 family)|nr:DUF378 domain-containing protein [Candidatus Sulfotelmatobacter sp.]
MSPQTKKWIHIVAFILVVIGAIDLGLFGIIPANSQGQGFDILHAIFGFSATLLEVLYALIGVSGVYLLITHKGNCTVCK